MCVFQPKTCIKIEFDFQTALLLYKILLYCIAQEPVSVEGV